tara:strand:- start:750 stop:3290 length:2541 start_codon:yes stop_codon:yes gene_type:complete
MNKERLKKLLNYRVSFNNAMKSFAFLSVVYILLLSLSSSLIHQFRVENIQLQNELSAADQELVSTREALVEEILTLEKKANRDYVKDSYEQNKMSLNHCGGAIGLYDTNKYTVTYNFPKGVTTFKIIFTDSTGDLEINLMERIKGSANIYEGEVSVDLYWEGEQGRDKLSIYVYARERGEGNVRGPESELRCTYDAYNMNFRHEGDYLRDHIRTPLVEDGYYNLPVTATGKVWEQFDRWSSPTDCAEDTWILDWRIDSYNSDLVEGEPELTPEDYCNSEVGTYFASPTWNNYFRYPVLTTNNAGEWSDLYEDMTTNQSKYETCFESINTEMKSYATYKVDEFASEITYGDMWAVGLSGDYRLVGLHLDEGIDYTGDNFYFSDWSSGVDPFHYSEANSWYDNKHYFGHRNNLPDSSFHLWEYGNVKEEAPHYISFIYEIHTFTGGAHGMYFYETFNYDLRTCKRIELKDMMTDKILKEQGYEVPEGSDALWLNLLTSRLGDIWSIEKGYIPGFVNWSSEPFKIPLDQETDEWWSGPPNYRDLSAVSINEYGLTFSFQPYAVDGWAGGWPEITISWGNLWDIFTWGDWEENNEFTIYENTVLLDSYTSKLEDPTIRLVKDYELNDLLNGVTHIYTHKSYSEPSKWKEATVEKQNFGTTYGLVGNFTEKDEIIVNKFVDSVNSIIGTEWFKFTSNKEEVTIPIEISKGHVRGNPAVSPRYNGIYFTEENSVWMDSDLFGIKRDNVLIHELGHSIGLHHSACIKTGIMSLNTPDSLIYFSDFEIAMINFIYGTPLYSVGNIGTYEKDIEDGMTYEDLVSFIGIPNKSLNTDSKFCPDERPTYTPEEDDEG